jgi:hypothetical protein
VSVLRLRQKRRPHFFKRSGHDSTAVEKECVVMIRHTNFRIRHSCITMAQPQQARLGGNLVLASLLALASYVPFEWVAKGSLVVCAILFIVDPIPPVTRLVSLVSLFLVFWVSKLYKQHQQQQAEEVTIQQQQQQQETTASSDDQKKEE